jgi:hypothetical protein
MGRMLVILGLLLVVIATAVAQRGPGDCAHLCNDLRRDVLTLEMCK